MAAALEPAQIARQKPAIDNGFQRQFRIVEIVRHHRLASHSDFADAVGVRTQNSQLDSRQRLADRVGAERLQIVERERRARFGEAVSIHHRNAEIVEELHGRRLHERAAGNQRQQLAAKSAVNARRATCG